MDILGDAEVDPAEVPPQSEIKSVMKYNATDFYSCATSISTVCQSDSEEKLYEHALEELSAKNEISGSCTRICDAEKTVYLEQAVDIFEFKLKTNELLNGILEEFCHIGLQYVERLESLGRRFKLLSDTESARTMSPIDSLRSYIAKVAEGHRDFIDAISNECVVPNNYSERLSKMKNEVSATQKTLMDSETRRNALVEEVNHLYLQANTAIKICEEALHQVPLMRTNLHMALISTLLRFLRQKNKLNMAEMSLADANNKLDKKYNEIHESLKNLDGERLLDLRDSFCKFIVYETARIRNLQYDMRQMAETLDDFGQNTDSEELVDVRQKYNSSHSKAAFSIINITKNYAKYLKFNIPEVFNNHKTSKVALTPPRKGVITMIENKMTSRFVNSVWDGELSQRIPIRIFIGEMQSSLVRQIFCKMLESKSLESNKLPSMHCLRVLAEMICTILTISELQGDSWTGYTILRISDSIHADIPQKIEGRSDADAIGSCVLRSLIYSHGYWNRIPFWEECLIIVVSEDLKTIFEELKCSKIAEKCLICEPTTEDAYSFCRWMINYGIEPLQSYRLIERVCKNLGLPAQYAKCLIGSDIV